MSLSFNLNFYFKRNHPELLVRSAKNLTFGLLFDASTGNFIAFGTVDTDLSLLNTKSAIDIDEYEKSLTSEIIHRLRFDQEAISKFEHYTLSNLPTFPYLLLLEPDLEPYNASESEKFFAKLSTRTRQEIAKRESHPNSLRSLTLGQPIPYPRGFRLYRADSIPAHTTTSAFIPLPRKT